MTHLKVTTHVSLPYGPIYSGPYVKGHSREGIPLERTQIPGSRYYECV